MAQAALLALDLYKQPHRAHVRIARGRDVPAGWASILPTHLQRNVMPAIREQSPEALAGGENGACPFNYYKTTGICYLFKHFSISELPIL